jgi:hypothetical protein
MSKINESIMSAYNGIMTEGAEGAEVEVVQEQEEVVLKESNTVSWTVQDAGIEWNDNEVLFDAVCELDVTLGEEELEVNDISVHELSFNDDDEDDVDLSKINPEILSAVKEAISIEATESRGEELVKAIQGEGSDGSDEYDRMMDRPEPDEWSN